MHTTATLSTHFKNKNSAKNSKMDPNSALKWSIVCIPKPIIPKPTIPNFLPHLMNELEVNDIESDYPETSPVFKHDLGGKLFRDSHFRDFYCRGFKLRGNKFRDHCSSRFNVSV